MVSQVKEPSVTLKLSRGAKCRTGWCVTDLNVESHAPPGRSICQLVQDPLRAYEAPFSTAVVFDNPGNTSLDWRSAESRSLPFRYIPASGLRESRAPRPASWTGDGGTPTRGKQHEQEKGDLFESQCLLMKSRTLVLVTFSVSLCHHFVSTSTLGSVRNERL